MILQYQESRSMHGKVLTDLTSKLQGIKLFVKVHNVGFNLT